MKITDQCEARQWLHNNTMWGYTLPNDVDILLPIQLPLNDPARERETAEACANIGWEMHPWKKEVANGNNGYLITPMKEDENMAATSTPSFRAKHYRTLATAVAEGTASAMQEAARRGITPSPGMIGAHIISALGDTFKADNPRFDNARFVSLYLEQVKAHRNKED